MIYIYFLENSFTKSYCTNIYIHKHVHFFNKIQIYIPNYPYFNYTGIYSDILKFSYTSSLKGIVYI